MHSRRAPKWQTMTASSLILVVIVFLHAAISVNADPSPIQTAINRWHMLHSFKSTARVYQIRAAAPRRQPVANPNQLTATTIVLRLDGKTYDYTGQSTGDWALHEQAHSNAAGSRFQWDTSAIEGQPFDPLVDLHISVIDAFAKIQQMPNFAIDRVVDVTIERHQENYAPFERDEVLYQFHLWRPNDGVSTLVQYGAKRGKMVILAMDHAE